MTPAHLYDYHLCRLRLHRERSGATPGIEMPGEIRDIALPGGRIRVNLAGAGPQTVLLCPDPPHVLESYAPLIRTLAARFRVLSFETPGFGYSRPARDYDYSLDALAGVIGGVLDASETQRVFSAVPCGNGFGALRFAQLHPGRVAGLISIQTPDFGEYQSWIERVDPDGRLRTPLSGQRQTARDLQTVSRNWLRVAENDRTVQAGYIESCAGHLDNGACYCLASALQKFVATDDPFRDWRLDAPAAVLWGAADKTYRRRPAFSFESYLSETPADRTLAVPKVGHFPEMSRPDLLLQLVESLVAVAD